MFQNEGVEDFPTDEAAPSCEGRHAGTGLPIHERFFHHRIVTAWAYERSGGHEILHNRHDRALQKEAGVGAAGTVGSIARGRMQRA